MFENGWSFCIVTNKMFPDTINGCIDSVLNVFDKHTQKFEIIVIGNSKINYADRSNIYAIDFQEKVFSPTLTRPRLSRFKREKKLSLFFYKEGWITKKKNIAASLAKYNKLCILHDYVALDQNWLSGFQLFGENWDVCTTKIFNKDGKRHRDWLTWDYPVIGRALAPYDCTSLTKYMYINGAYFCVKKEFYMNNMLDEKLCWGEGEDVEWSKRIRKKTNFTINPNSSVTYLKLKQYEDTPECWNENNKKLYKELGYDFEEV